MQKYGLQMTEAHLPSQTLEQVTRLSVSCNQTFDWKAVQFWLLCHATRKEAKGCLTQRDQGPVSQKSRIVSGLFRVLQFPSYLRNAEVLYAFKLRSPLGLSHVKNL